MQTTCPFRRHGHNSEVLPSDASVHGMRISKQGLDPKVQVGRSVAITGINIIDPDAGDETRWMTLLVAASTGRPLPAERTWGLSQPISFQLRLVRRCVLRFGTKRHLRTAAGGVPDFCDLLQIPASLLTPGPP